MDEHLFKRYVKEMDSSYIQLWESATNFLQNGFGLCILKDGEFVSICNTYYVKQGFAEIDIVTKKEYRNQGFATIVCSEFIKFCVENDIEPLWDCDAGNDKMLSVVEVLTCPSISLTILIRSAPFAPFLRQDILQLALDLKVPVPETYGTIERKPDGTLYTTSTQRIGCSMCGFGIHMEKRPHWFDQCQNTLKQLLYQSQRLRLILKKIIRRYGADQFVSGYQGNKATIGFTLNNRQVRFIIELPDKSEKRFLYTTDKNLRRTDDAAAKEWEQACR